MKRDRMSRLFADDSADSFFLFKFIEPLIELPFITAELDGDANVQLGKKIPRRLTLLQVGHPFSFQANCLPALSSWRNRQIHRAS